ncbi:MAG TPA: arsenite methyltransferase [Bacteroidota bacterium]
MMDTEKKIKDAVVERYTDAALQDSGCCSSSCGCGGDNAPGMNEQYSSTDQRILEEADLGLGCGNPTAFAELKNGMTVLDLGSGAGIDVFLAAKEVGPTGKAIGLDMTPAMIDRATKNKEKLGIANVEFVLGSIDSMPLQSDSVDYVLSNCVLNLVPDKRKAFLEMFRVLRANGRFTVSDIVTVGEVNEDARNNLSLWTNCVSGAVEKQQYVEELRKAGFSDVRIMKERTVNTFSEYGFGLVSITVTGTK